MCWTSYEPTVIHIVHIVDIVDHVFLMDLYGASLKRSRRWWQYLKNKRRKTHANSQRGAHITYLLVPQSKSGYQSDKSLPMYEPRLLLSSIMFWWLVFLLRVGELRTWCNLMKWVSWVFLYTCSRSLVVNFVVFFTKLVDQVVKLISCCITLSLNCYWVAIVCSTRSQFEFLHG